MPATLSLKATAAALGVPKATMAERAAAERSSGYVIGGISPFGQRRPLRLNSAPKSGSGTYRGRSPCDKSDLDEV